MVANLFHVDKEPDMTWHEANSRFSQFYKRP